MKLSFLLLSILLSTLSFSQITLSGIVSDTDEAHLPLANIIAKDSSSNSIYTYSITDNKGYYKVDLKIGVTYFIDISYVGKITIHDTIRTKNKDFDINYTLMPNQFLNEIDLVYKMPISVNGDTVAYNAESFSNGNEDVLGDILTKLPGVDVNEEGEILVNGKKVNKVTVEGRDFFDGDSKLATKNIPADAIETIEVLKNYDDVAMLKNMRNNEDNIAINLKLKEGKKEFLFGHINTAIGLPSRYKINPTLFYYSPKYSLNLISNYNNTGEASLTFKDYFKFSGGFNSLISGNGIATDMGNDSFFQLTLDNKKAQNIINQFSGLNFAYAHNSKLESSGYAIYSNKQTTNRTEIAQQYLLNNKDNLIRETIKRNRELQDKLGLFNTKLKYKPNSKKELSYQINGRIINQNINSITESSISNKNEENGFGKHYEFGHILNWYQTINSNNIFSINGSSSHKNKKSQNEFKILSPSQFGFNEFFEIPETIHPLKIIQNQENRLNRYELTVNYWKRLNKNNNIELSTGLSLTHEILRTSLNNHNQTTMNLLSGGQLDFSILNHFYKLSYRYKINKVLINPYIVYMVNRFYSNQNKNQDIYTHAKPLVGIDFRYHFTSTKDLTLSYSEQINTINTIHLLERYRLVNVNQLFIGNKELRPYLNNTYKIEYSNFNEFSQITFNSSIHYIQNRQANGNSITNEISGINSTVSQKQLNSDTESLSGYISGSKVWNKIKFQGQIQSQFYKGYQFHNSIENVNKSESYTYNLSARSNYKNMPNLEIGYKKDKQYYLQNTSKSTFITHSPFIKLRYKIKNSLRFNIEYMNSIFIADAMEVNRQNILKVGINYKQKESKLSYSISMDNVLNNSTINTNTSNNISFSNTIHYVRPRYILFGIDYKF